MARIFRRVEFRITMFLLEMTDRQLYEQVRYIVETVCLSTSHVTVLHNTSESERYLKLLSNFICCRTNEPRFISTRQMAFIFSTVMFVPIHGMIDSFNHLTFHLGIVYET